MKRINQKQFAFTAGLASVVIYIGCILFMAILGREHLIELANLLFHGMDFTNIIRTEISLIESAVGIIVSFLFWGLLAYLFALIFNRIKL